MDRRTVDLSGALTMITMGTDDAEAHDVSGVPEPLDPARATSARYKAYAHPTRREMVTLFRRRGRLRAADVAEALEIAASTASFHLRVLADAGVIEEAPEHARDRRDRVWVTRPPDEAPAMFARRSVRLTAAEFEAVVERIEGVISAAVDAHPGDDPDTLSWQIEMLAACGWT